MKKVQRSIHPADELKSQIDTLCAAIYKRIDPSTLHLISTVPTDPENNCKVNWLRHVFNTLINSKQNLEELMLRREQSECGQYQRSLQKMEAQIRRHIALQQEMKLVIDRFQQKFVQIEQRNSKLQQQLQKYKRKEKVLLTKKQERQIKTARGRSSTMSIIKHKGKDENINLMNIHGQASNSNLMNCNNKKVKKEAGRIRNCR